MSFYPLSNQVPSKETIILDNEWYQANNSPELRAQATEAIVDDILNLQNEAPKTRVSRFTLSLISDYYRADERSLKDFLETEGLKYKNAESVVDAAAILINSIEEVRMGIVDQIKNRLKALEFSKETQITYDLIRQSESDKSISDRLSKENISPILIKAIELAFKDLQPMQEDF